MPMSKKGHSAIEDLIFMHVYILKLLAGLHTEVKWCLLPCSGVSFNYEKSNS